MIEVSIVVARVGGTDWEWAQGALWGDEKIFRVNPDQGNIVLGTRPHPTNRVYFLCMYSFRCLTDFLKIGEVRGMTHGLGPVTPFS